MTPRRVDRQRHAVGHAVRDADELDRERADGDPIARPRTGRASRIVDAVLASFGSTSASVSGVP